MKISSLKVMRVASISLITLLSIFLTACGSGSGGGGGGGSSGDNGISYTGFTTQAIINENNAEDLVIGALAGLRISLAVGGIPSNAQSVESEPIDASRLLSTSQALENSLRRIEVTSRSGDARIGAVHSASDTINGDCGGSALINIEIDDETGELSGTVTYDGYCSGGVTLSGSANISGKYNFSTEDISTFSFTFTTLTGTSENDSFTLKGNISYDFTVSPAIAAMDILFQIAATKKVYWVKDYEITATGGVWHIEITLSGNYYDPDYGFVILYMDTPFIIYDEDSWPSDGVLVITGDTGSAGGSTSARLTMLPSATYRVEADTNGDGSFDWNSGVLYWSEGDDGQDTQAPTVPNGLTAVAVSHDTIVINWSASIDNVGVAGYRVYRNDARIGATLTTQYIDTGLLAATRYCYTVVAYDAAGNTSGYSNQDCATIEADGCGTGLPLVLSDLVFPTTVRSGTTTANGSVTYRGSFEDIADPLMFSRIPTSYGEAIGVQFEAPTVSNNCTINFVGRIGSCSGRCTVYFKLIDVDGSSTMSENWRYHGVSNEISQTVTIE